MILSKGLNALGGDSNELCEPLRGSSPPPREYIRHLNYQELEDKYAIQRYIPRYIHNGDYSTPVLRDMIGTRPIYSDVNKKMRLHQKRLHRRQERHSKIARKLKKYDNDDDINEIGRLLSEELVFNNPWDSYPEEKPAEDQLYQDQMNYPNVKNYTTKRDRRGHDAESSHLTSRLAHKALGREARLAKRGTRRGTEGNIGTNIPEKNSIGANGRVSDDNILNPIDFIREELHSLVKSNSYDQTKSTMTKERRSLKSIKQRLISFSSRKRSSEQIGMYTNFKKWGS